MICPMCGSNNVIVQAVMESRLKNKGHGCLHWLLIGWWVEILLWVFLFVPKLLATIFIPKRQKIVQHMTKKCVCQNCGYIWDIR